MINRKSIEFYTLSWEREKKLWQDCIFVFDTSALLDFYYYSDEIRSSIFKEIFPKLIDRLWIPHRVEYEYLKNREKTILKPINNYNRLLERDNNNNDSGNLEKIKQSITNIRRILASEMSAIDGQVKTLRESTSKKDKHPYLEDVSLVQNFQEIVGDFQNSIKTRLEEFNLELDRFNTSLEEEVLKKKNIIQVMHENDSVLEEFSKFFQVGEPYSYDKLMQIVKEGELRYSSKIPPGYKDKNEKEGISIYGDLIIWKQIIDYVQENKKPIILIIDDQKEDCWNKKTTEMPREDLINEFYTITGMEFWMYTLPNFIFKAQRILSITVDSNVLETVKEIEKKAIIEKQREVSENQEAIITFLSNSYKSKAEAIIEKQQEVNENEEAITTFLLEKAIKRRDLDLIEYIKRLKKYGLF